jgi:hypothetical protein
VDQRLGGYGDCRQTGENTYQCDYKRDGSFGPVNVTIQNNTPAAWDGKTVVTGSLSFELPIPHDATLREIDRGGGWMVPGSFDSTGAWYKQIMGQYGDLLQGVARMACEALLCMGGGGGAACQPSLDIYYSIRGETDAETKAMRLEFLSQCPMS